jgi:hypothetical protein
MGGSAAASPDALVALWVNPAGLAGAPGQVGATHTAWLFDTRMEQLGAVLGGTGRLVFGLSAQIVTTGDIPLRPATAGVPVPYLTPLGTFAAKDFGVGLSAGWRLGGSMQAGASVRWLAQKVYVYDASAPSLDLGFSWQARPQVRLSACVNNIGPALEWENGVSSPLPLAWRAGLAWSLGRELLLVGDLLSARERGFRATTGAQWRPNALFALRGGLVAGQDEQHFSAGTGLFWRGLGFEYAVAPRSADLGTVHRFALHFTPSRQKPKVSASAGD